MNYNAIISNEFIYEQKILGMSAYSDGKNLKIVVASTKGGINLIAIIDWSYYQPVIISTTTQLDPQLQAVTKIIQTAKFVAVAYQKTSPSFGSYLIILRNPYKMSQQFPIIYQSPLYTKSFTFDFDPLQNNLLIFSSNNNQQMLKITDPLFKIAQKASGSSAASVQIQCMGYLANLSSSAPAPAFTTQVQQTAKISFYSSNMIYIVQKNQGQVAAQSLTTNAPGETILDLQQFYYGPALSFTVQDSTDQGFTKNSSATIYSTYRIISNSSFKFPFGSQNIKLIKAFELVRNYFYWFVELGNGQFYDYIQNQNTLEFEKAVQITEQPFISSSLINYYYIYPYIQIFLEEANQCTVQFLNLHSSVPYFSLTVCDNKSFKIQDIVLINKDLFILADPQNASVDSTNGQILKVSITNSSLTTRLKFSQIPKTLIKQSSFVSGQTLSSFVPVNIILDWTRPNIYYIQCAGQIIIADLNYYHIYQVISLPTGVTLNYQIAVTQHSLFIITASQVIEYSIRDLDNLKLLRANIPNYSSQSVNYAISKNLFAFTKEILILYETNAKQLLIIDPSQGFTFNVIRDVQTLVKTPVSLITTFNAENKVLQLQVFYQNSGIDIFQIYFESFAAFKGYQLQQSNTQQQKYNFAIAISSKFGQSTSTIPSINCSITMNYVNTQISLLSNQKQIRQISIPLFTDNNIKEYNFQFPSSVYFSGSILNYYIDCEYKSECNNTIVMQGVLDESHYLSTNTEFFALAKGSNNFTYAQSENRIFRLGTQENKFYDYVQLPFYNLYKYCTQLVADPTDLFTVSACSDFESPWILYFSSFISSEPHLLGQVTILEPKFVYQMYLMANYLFVVDAANDLSTFNGIHIYKLNFNADFDPTTFALPQFAYYERTLHLEYFGFKKNITSLDIIQKDSSFQFGFALADGTVQFVEYQPNAVQSEYFFVNAFSVNIVNVIKSKDIELAHKNIDFVPYLNGIKFIKYVNASQQIEAVFLFKFFHSYDLLFTYKVGQSDFMMVPQFKFKQYAYYESQNNIQVIDVNNLNYVLFSGYLPSYLTNQQNNNYPPHILFSYNKQSSQQNQELTTSFVELSVSGGYSFKTQKQFVYQIQSYQGLTTTNASIMLVNPDDYTFQSFCLNRNLSLVFKSDHLKSKWVKIYASSLFSSASYQFLLASFQEFPLPYNGTYPTNYSYQGAFPSNFLWGLGTAAYQIEGGYNSQGRGASIWDTFTGANTVGMVGSNCSKQPCDINPSMVAKGSTGNVADNQFELYESDVQLMKEMGLKSYRFSISWSRIAPDGNVNNSINLQGLQYYDQLINLLIENGIEPFVTLYHWDLPQALLMPEKGMYGWYSVDNNSQPNYQMTDYFTAYADVCFQYFGDRVKNWITFNEPWTFCLQGCYLDAPNLPGYQSLDKWPYIAAHNVLNAHAKTVQLYRTKYKSTQMGRIAMTVNEDWREPKTHEQADIEAAERAVEFSIGWFTDPLYFGEYPYTMRERVPLLPVFSQAESQLIQGSNDFFGLNHYTTHWAVNGSCGSWCPQQAVLSSDGFIQSESSWLYAVPWGLRKLLNWVKNRYDNPEIIITENGWSWPAKTPQEQFNDDLRVQYFANYTSELLTAINTDGVNVTGYYGWSFLDNFEWVEGYTQRFGVVFSNYNFGYDPNSPLNQNHQPTKTQTRNRKKSSYWWEQVWKNNQLVDPYLFTSNYSFLNSDQIFAQAIQKATILWNAQWQQFELCKNLTLKEELINIKLRTFILSTATQQIMSLSLANYQSQYLPNLLNRLSIPIANQTQIASLIYNSSVTGQDSAGWVAFHLFNSLPNTTNIQYSLLFSNMITNSSVNLFNGIMHTTFSLASDTLVLYKQLSYAGQDFTQIQNLAFQSSGQAQSTFDSVSFLILFILSPPQILNYFFIAGCASFADFMGVSYTLPSDTINAAMGLETIFKRNQIKI